MRPGLSAAPYPGLRSFHRHEFDIFFGRDDHVDAMIDKLAQSHFLCVNGPSGCGKSSLARTGLINALEAGFLHGRGSDWVICDTSPGGAPLTRLSHALAAGILQAGDGGAPDPDRADELAAFFRTHMRDVSSDLNPAVKRAPALGDRPVLILVDQFEELFRYAQEDRHAAARFVDVLLRTAEAEAGQIYVVITVRTEELANCARYPGLTGAINRSQFLTPTLDRFQLQEAIEGPIELSGGEIDPKLTNWMLNDLEKEMDKLPLAQHALKLLYDHKMAEAPDEPPVIGLADYQRVFDLPAQSGLSRKDGESALRMAMSNRLDRIYDRLPDHLRNVAPRSFCALTNVASQGRDIRQPLALSQLAAIADVSMEDMRDLVGRFAGPDTGYLRSDSDLAADDPQIDVTHECVLRVWRRLQDKWLRRELRNAEEIKLLARRAQVYTEHRGKATGWFGRLGLGRLLSWADQQHYRHWWKRARPNAAWAGRYLREVARGLRTAAYSDGPAPAVGFAKLKRYLEKSRQVTLATRGIIAALVVLVAAGGGLYLNNERQKSIRAEEARQIELDRIAQERERSEALARENREQAAFLTAASLNPGKSDSEPAATVFNAVQAVGAAIDAETSARGVDVAAAKLWQSLFFAYERQRLTHASGSVGHIYGAAFLDGGDRVLTLSHAAVLSFWNRAEGTLDGAPLELRPVLTFDDAQNGRSLRVSPDGRFAAIGTRRGSVAMVDLASRTPRELYLGPVPFIRSSVLDVAFSGDGRLMAAASLDGKVRLWRLGPGGALDDWVELPSQAMGGSVWSVALDETGALLAAGRGDGQVCLVELGPRNRVCYGEGHEKGNTVKAVQFRPGKGILVSGGNDDRVVVWKLARPESGPILNLSGQVLWRDSDVWSVDFDRSGRLLAAISWDGSIQLYNADGWKPLAAMRGHTRAPRSMAFDPGGQYLVSGATDGTARIWSPFAPVAEDADFSYRYPGKARDGNTHDIARLRFAPGAEWLAFTDRLDVMVKPARGAPQVISRGDGTDRRYLSLDVSTTGAIAAARRTARIDIWQDTGQGWRETRLSPQFPGHDLNLGRRPVAFSPDGSRIAVGLRHADGYAVGICPVKATSCGTDLDDLIPIIPIEDPALVYGCRISPARVNALAWSADGAQLAVGARDCAVRVYDMTGDVPGLRRQLLDHRGAITTVQFSPDGARIVSGSSDWTARVWTIETGASVHLEKQHISGVNAARFSPTGNRVATVSSDEKLIIWDAATGTVVASLPGHESSIRAVDIATGPDGAPLLATSTSDGDINVLPFFEDTSALQSYARTTLVPVLGAAPNQNED